MPAMYRPEDIERVVEESNGAAGYRREWRRDYARLIHSPAFRRLQGKTQVFPGHESDFYRNRLTHSMEVAQIAKSIAIKLNATHQLFADANQKIDPDLVEFAGLAHDLGHPPFGHNGEEALDDCMKDHGGFEGNAQTLRIISRLEKKRTLKLVEGEVKPFDEKGTDLRVGLNLTYRSLAAVLKYDEQIPERYSDRAKPAVMKGYYGDDAALVAKIKEHVLGGPWEQKFKTIECSIMDIADDIAYSTYDLEDNFKAGFLKPLDLFVLSEEIYDLVSETINSRLEKQYPESTDRVDAGKVKEVLRFIFEDLLFAVESGVEDEAPDNTLGASAKKMLAAADVQQTSQKLAHDGYARTDFTSSLVSLFVDGIEIVENKSYPQLHQARLNIETFLKVEVLKNITFETVIRSSTLQVIEYRGKEIVKAIFSAIADKENDGTRLLPDDVRRLCQGVPEVAKYRTICDYIAGMTDRYAFEFYGRLHGTGNLTVHKPF